MSEADKATWREQFEKLGVNQVRAQLLAWTGPVQMEANQWLAEKDEESTRLAEASRAEQFEIARSAKDAAFEANTLASEANRLALEANSIARDAAASAQAAAAAAAASARAAHTNNIIATLALIIAVIAIAISTLGIFIKH